MSHQNSDESLSASSTFEKESVALKALPLNMSHQDESLSASTTFEKENMIEGDLKSTSQTISSEEEESMVGSTSKPMSPKMTEKSRDGSLSPCSMIEEESMIEGDSEDDCDDVRANFNFLQEEGFSEFGESAYHQEQEHEAMREALKHSTVVFAGNPGTGKSTLLNSLCQPEQPQFKAGLSFGAGLTRVCQEYTSERLNTTFVDTPGLNDISYVEEAAKEISEMLQHNAKLGRHVKLGFFAQLNSGRVRPEDVTTMNAILDSINLPDMNDRFVLIINKLDPLEYRYLKDHSSEEFAKVVGCCFVKYRTNLVVTLPRESELETLSTPYLSHDLMKDVVVRLLQADCVTLDADRLLEVDPREWDKKVSMIKAEMGELATMLEEKEEELQSLMKRQSNSDKEREALKTELDEQVAKLTNATANAEKAREEAEALASHMQAMTDQISQLSLEREQILQDRTADGAQLAAQIEKLSAQLLEIQQEKEQLMAAQQDSEQISKQMEAISSQMSQLSEERDQLVETKHRQEDLSAQLEDVTSKLETLNQEKGAHASRISAMELERERMEAQLQKAEKTAKSVKKVKKRALAFATFGLSLAFSGKHHKDEAPIVAEPTDAEPSKRQPAHVEPNSSQVQA